MKQFDSVLFPAFLKNLVLLAKTSITLKSPPILSIYHLLFGKRVSKADHKMKRGNVTKKPKDQEQILK